MIYMTDVTINLWAVAALVFFALWIAALLTILKLKEGERD